jgi:hypothetical protein
MNKKQASHLLAQSERARAAPSSRQVGCAVGSLWLDPIPAFAHGDAIAALDEGDSVGFLMFGSNTESIALVARNAAALIQRGLFEETLLQAFVASRTNNAHHSMTGLRWLFSLANRAKLRAAGDRLPSAGPFTVYRGVAGKGAARRIRGLSWTDSQETARWFANRFASVLPDPAVYQVTVEEQHVLAYLHDKGRNESEYIVALPAAARPKRVEVRHA